MRRWLPILPPAYKTLDRGDTETLFHYDHEQLG
jgi:hypothetical protein